MRRMVFKHFRNLVFHLDTRAFDNLLFLQSDLEPITLIETDRPIRILGKKILRRYACLDYPFGSRDRERPRAGCLPVISRLWLRSFVVVSSKISCIGASSGGWL